MLQMRRSRPSALARGTVRGGRRAGWRAGDSFHLCGGGTTSTTAQSLFPSVSLTQSVDCLVLRRDGEPTTAAAAASVLQAGRDEATRGLVSQRHPLHPRVPPADQGGGDGPAALLGAPRASGLDAGAGRAQGLAAASGAARGARQPTQLAGSGQVAPAAHRTHPHQEGLHVQVADPGARQRHHPQGFFRKVCVALNEFLSAQK